MRFACRPARAAGSSRLAARDRSAVAGILAAALLCAVVVACGGGDGAGPALSLAGDADEGWRVELRDVDDPSAGTLRVYTGGAPVGAGRSAIVGAVDQGRTWTTWVPRYRLRPGQEYTAVWQPADGAALSHTFTLPAPDLESTTRVSAVYPATDVVPENLLRLYVQFSAPMTAGRAREFIELVDGAGAPIEDAFVIPDEELWSAAGDRITLFFDPGRLKQEVGPNVAMGAPLRDGDEVVLRIGQAWVDGAGAPLAAGYEKRWRVVAADRTSPDPRQWALRAPATAAAPLILMFREPLDHALLQRMLIVESAAGEPIAGDSRVPDGEREWHFAPADPWQPGRYFVRVDTRLEDVAGNSVGRLFDEPLVDDQVGVEAPPVISLPFAVAEPALSSDVQPRSR